MSSIVSTLSEITPYKLPSPHRCLKLALLWQCGHTEELDPMEGDCPAPDDDPTYHIEEHLHVDADSPCPVCETPPSSPGLLKRICSLESRLASQMEQEGFLEWQADHKHVPKDFWRSPDSFAALTPISPTTSKSSTSSFYPSTSAKLQARLKNLTAILHTGFEIHASSSMTPTSKTQHHPAEHSKRQYAVLRGQSAFRHEFVPGVWWMGGQLSRRQSALRRDQWRRQHGMVRGKGQYCV